MGQRFDGNQGSTTERVVGQDGSVTVFRYGDDGRLLDLGLAAAPRWPQFAGNDDLRRACAGEGARDGAKV